jgi:hypothetical protein
MLRKTNIIIFTLLIISVVVFPACSNSLSQAEQEIEELKLEIAELQEEIDTRDEEISDHDILTRNLNRLLSTVYYGSATPVTEGREKSFTAFSMYYKEKFYLITAGHCIEYDNIKYTGFKFKSNERSSWIYPELLYFEADYENNKDFAIFTHRHIRKGLMIEEDDMEPRYVLGNIERKLNFFKEFSNAREGESGSPVLSKGCKLVGIVIKNSTDYTPISEVTRAIDRILEE